MEYAWGKQTIIQLAEAGNVSRPSMSALLDAYEPPETQPYQELTPCSIVLVIDAFYWQRGDGVILFRAINLKRNLLWFAITSETTADYLTGIDLLIKAGWTIIGFVVDGRKGVVSALEKIAPVQYCQFHQKKTIRGYLTKNPKHEAAIELKVIADKLTTTDKPLFVASLQKWHTEWDSLLKERTQHPGGTWSYTHSRLRSAYFSLVHNVPWLFTCRDHAEIPNTTNSLDGSISHLRTLHRVHRGVQLRRRRNLTETLLRGKTD